MVLDLFGHIAMTKLGQATVIILAIRLIILHDPRILYGILGETI